MHLKNYPTIVYSDSAYFCIARGLRRGGLTPVCGFVHARSCRGCRQIEDVNATVLSRAALRMFHGCISFSGERETYRTSCELRATLLIINRLKEHHRALYLYTPQSCDYSRPVRLVFGIGRLFVCGGGVLLAASITASSSSISLNLSSRPSPSSS